MDASPFLPALPRTLLPSIAGAEPIAPTTNAEPLTGLAAEVAVAAEAEAEEGGAGVDGPAKTLSRVAAITAQLGAARLQLSPRKSAPSALVSVPVSPAAARRPATGSSPRPSAMWPGRVGTAVPSAAPPLVSGPPGRRQIVPRVTVPMRQLMPNFTAPPLPAASAAGPGGGGGVTKRTPTSSIGAVWGAALKRTPPSSMGAAGAAKSTPNTSSWAITHSGGAEAGEGAWSRATSMGGAGVEEGGGHKGGSAGRWSTQDSLDESKVRNN